MQAIKPPKTGDFARLESNLSLVSFSLLSTGKGVTSMKRIKAGLLGLAALTLSAVALAENAAPFGFELGVATMSQVKTGMQGASVDGLNEHTRGPMLRTTSTGVDGVHEVVFIFTPDNVLVGALVTMNKDPVSAVKTLQKKYKMTSNRVDSFMNNGNAEFVKGDSVIQLVAPHLSFQQHILYATKGMYATFRGNMNESSAQKQQRKDSAL